MIITASQIRAGRALANMNQGELAEASGLARPTIVKIEREEQVAGEKTLIKISAALEHAGIEFFGNDGVRKKKQSVRVFRGKNDFRKFYLKVQKHAETQGGQFFLSNADERLFIHWGDGFFEKDYVPALEACRDNHDYRILVKQVDNFIPASSYARYRCIPENQFSNIPFFVYGDILSVILFMDEPIIFSIKDEKAATLYKNKFLDLWDNALEIAEDSP